MGALCSSPPPKQEEALVEEDAVDSAVGSLVDWPAVLDAVPIAPPVYDPLVPRGDFDSGPAFAAVLSTMSCLEPRARCCAQPPLLCPCAAIVKAAAPPHTAFSLLEPDAVLHRLLSYEDARHCPEDLRGVYAWRDAWFPQTLLTLSDADWHSPKRASKGPWANVSSADTCCGACNLTNPNGVEIEISPDRRWMAFKFTASDLLQIGYVVQPGDTIRDPRNAVLDFQPGDIIVMTYADATTPASAVTFQASLRKVATLGAGGELVRTAAFSRLMDDARAPDGTAPCCGYFLCHVSGKELGARFRPQNPEQLIRFRDPRASSAEPVQGEQMARA